MSYRKGGPTVRTSAPTHSSRRHQLAASASCWWSRCWCIRLLMLPSDKGYPWSSSSFLSMWPAHVLDSVLIVCGSPWRKICPQTTAPALRCDEIERHGQLSLQLNEIKQCGQLSKQLRPNLSVFFRLNSRVTGSS